MMVIWNVFVSFSLLLIPLSIFTWLCKRNIYLAPQTLLRANNYGLGLVALLAVSAHLLTPSSKPQVRLSQAEPTALTFSLKMSETFLPEPQMMMAPQAQNIANATPIALVLFAVALLWMQLHQLYRHLGKSFFYKRIGHVTLRLKENLRSPYVISLFHRHTIVLPMWSLENEKHKRIFVAHELQHIRQGDTQMSYAVGILQWMYFWHPFFWLWKTQYEQIQEISCDCFLIGHKKINLREYTNCLLETHQKAWQNAHQPLGITLAFWRHKKHLLWRVKFMSDYQQQTKSMWKPVALFITTLCVLVSTAYASKGLHQRTIDKAVINEAIEGAVIGQSQLPIAEEVTKAIAEMTGTAEKRKFFRESLSRLKTHDKVFDEEMLQYGVPRELKAMALVESGVQNLAPQNGLFERSTGIWQIIAPTARKLGLTVNENTDERRDVVKATNAAIRYLVMNRARFNNWDLSVLSYNAGENAVAEAVKKAGSKDPMEVRKYLHPETQSYFVKVIAAMIIMGNPNLVAETI